MFGSYVSPDLVDHMIHFEHVEWHANWDHEPANTIKARREIFARAASENALVHAAHLPFPGLGYLSQEGDGWRFQAFGK